ncbi:MAG: hypothetical protein P4L81_01245 [Candidatus Pacebacteria bacterium]|nr:hypothetical protein [Candidatus Paceibacterota bacterium]
MEGLVFSEVKNDRNLVTIAGEIAGRYVLKSCTNSQCGRILEELLETMGYDPQRDHIRISRHDAW